VNTLIPQINADTIELARKVRQTCLTMCYKKKASHLGGAFSVADVLAVLYGDILAKDPSQPGLPERDRLYYSKGHACTALYAVLALSRYFPEEELDTFTENGSYFTSHVNHHVPGVELSTGSLGHALSVACGIALSGKRRGQSWHTYAIVSDGEMDEGSNWEAILFAPHHRLDNLTLIVDYNKIQSFGTVAEVLNLEPLAAKFEAFGWETIEADGHDHDKLAHALRKDQRRAGKPRAIIAHTVKGKGVSFMENQLAWHYKSPNEEQYKLAQAELVRGVA
jgi:transketolase